MFKAIYHFIRKLLFDEDAFIQMSSKLASQIRASLMVAGMSAVSFSDELTEALKKPEWESKVRTAGVIVAGLSLLLRAGDKTPEKVKELAGMIVPEPKQPAIVAPGP